MLSRSGSAALVFVLLLVVSCDGPVEPPRVHHTSCDDAPGVTHSGSVGNAVWRGADGPHRFSGTVSFATLEVEAGTLVCGEPGAILAGEKLIAIGTPDAPITFRAADPGAPWGGMELRNQEGFSEEEASELHHTLIRDMADGIDASDLIMRSSRVVKACQSGDCVAVSGTGYSGIRLEDVVIDSSGSHGVSSGWRAWISLKNVRIQNSAGIGLISSAGDETNGVGVTAEGLRIVGGGSYPASIGGWQLEKLAGSREAVDSLLGNASDTLRIAVGSDAMEAPMTVYRDLPWRLRTPVGGGYGPSTLMVPDLTIEPGASISFEHRDEIVLRVRDLRAVGTAEEPVVLDGGVLAWGPGGDAAADTVRLANARLIRMQVRSLWPGGAVTLELDGVEATETDIVVDGGTRAAIANAAFDSSSLVVEVGQATLTDVEFLRAGGYRDVPHWGPELAPAIRVDSGPVTISGCEIRDGLSDALRVSEDADEGTSITGCNLVNNAGFGVNNLSAFTVDAGANWWGDPAGPDGPDGDGVSGDVVVEPVRTEPVQR